MNHYFEKFRKNIVGSNSEIPTPYGMKPLVYSDWTASGRFYRPIEDILTREIGPYIANTHTESSYTGSYMTELYFDSKKIIKQHVNADKNDALIFCGSGMTGAINKLQRMMGLRVPISSRKRYTITSPEKKNRPLVLISHMEHHSNHTSWLETVADVKIVKYLDEGAIDFNDLELQLKKHNDRVLKIVSFTACSNVTGIQTPITELSEIAHRYGAYFFVDYACSGPYVDINMHPEDGERIDAVFLSPHKFLGGPGTPGIVIFNTALYHSKVPDNPGGGTVLYTNPWKEHQYYDDIEVREDGGTPPFIQGIKAGLAIELKEDMGVSNIMNREREMNTYIFDRFSRMDNVILLADKYKQRMGVYSFNIPSLHYNLGVQLLNDLYGIQVRGGCACAGTYGHILLKITYDKSHEYMEDILRGEVYKRPGWIRMSIHPTMSDERITYIMDAIEELSTRYRKYVPEYTMNKKLAVFTHNSFTDKKTINRIKVIYNGNRKYSY